MTDEKRHIDIRLKENYRKIHVKNIWVNMFGNNEEKWHMPDKKIGYNKRYTYYLKLVYLYFFRYTSSKDTL